MRIVEHAIKQKWKEKSQQEIERDPAAHRHRQSYQKLQVGKSNADYQTHTLIQQRKKEET